MDLAANPAGLDSANPGRTQHRGALAPICDVVSARCAQMLSQSLKFVYVPGLREDLPLADIAVPDVLRGHRDEGYPAEFEPFTRLALADGSCTNM